MIWHQCHIPLLLQSGGPLVITRESGETLQVGIVSFGFAGKFLLRALQLFTFDLESLNKIAFRSRPRHHHIPRPSWWFRTCQFLLWLDQTHCLSGGSQGQHFLWGTQGKNFKAGERRQRKQVLSFKVVDHLLLSFFFFSILLHRSWVVGIIDIVIKGGCVCEEILGYLCVSALCERIIWEIALLLKSSCSCTYAKNRSIRKKISANEIVYRIIGVLM